MRPVTFRSVGNLPLLMLVPMLLRLLLLLLLCGEAIAIKIGEAGMHIILGRRIRWLSGEEQHRFAVFETESNGLAACFR